MEKKCKHSYEIVMTVNEVRTIIEHKKCTKCGHTIVTARGKKKYN